MKYCCSCGTALPDTAAFCSACGKAVEEPIARPVAQEAPAAPAAPEVPRRGALFSTLSLSLGVAGIFIFFFLVTFISYVFEEAPLTVLISSLLSVICFLLAIIFSLKAHGEHPRAIGLVGRIMGFIGIGITGIVLLSGLLPHLLNL